MEAVADDITFKPAWQLHDSQITGDVKRLWAEQGIPEALTKGRESEICAAAYGGDEIAAVATAEIFYFPPMRSKFFVYRCLVSPSFRKRNLSWRISEYSFKILHEWCGQNRQEKILGLMMVIETDKFAVPQRKPIRHDFGMTLNFAGYTPEGHQIRIVWFDDAELDDGAVRG